MALVMVTTVCVLVGRTVRGMGDVYAGGGKGR
jgi:hypothetical protein